MTTEQQKNDWINGLCDMNDRQLLSFV